MMIIIRKASYFLFWKKLSLRAPYKPKETVENTALSSEDALKDSWRRR
jgi:hypothetical protein